MEVVTKIAANPAAGAPHGESRTNGSALHRPTGKERLVQPSSRDPATGMALVQSVANPMPLITIPSVQRGAQTRMADNNAGNAGVVIGNLTWGLPNTLIGLAGMAVDAPVSLAAGRPASLCVSSNGSQLRYDGVLFPPAGWEASYGLIEFGGGYGSRHEGGHAAQSAILGPLYLPIIGLDYLINSYSGSFMERWADNLAR